MVEENPYLTHVHNGVYGNKFIELVCAAGGKVSALAPLRRPQNATGTLHRRALGPGEDGGLGADRQSVHTGLPADYREASTSFSEANPTANRMQAVLDKLCGIFFNDLCTLGVQPFCNGDAVARYGAGKADTKDEAWRCYAGKTLGNSQTKMQCIDDCGYTFPCEGNVSSDSLYLTLERPLQEMPAKIIKSTCPQSQRALNQYCATFGEDHVARFSSTPKSSEPSWRCFKKVNGC